MKLCDKGVYIDINGEERCIPHSVYKKAKESVENMHEEIEKLPFHKKLLNKSLLGAIQQAPVHEITKATLQQLCSAVEELGGKVVWEEECS